MLKQAHVTRIEQKYAIPPHKAQELAAAGVLASVTQEEIAQMLNRNGVEGGGILIRYPSTQDEMFAVRLDIPRRRQDGKIQKYDRPAGKPPRLFVPPVLDLDKTEEVWITEGEMKALAAWAHGLPVVALAGVWNWRRDVDESDPELAAAKLAGPGGKAPDPEALIPDLAREWSGKTVVFVYDSDITQGHVAWPAFGRLAEQLYAMGAVAVKVISLPAVEPEPGEEEGGAKTGIDDYIRRRKATGFDPVAELRELVNRAPVWVPSGGELLGCPEKTATLDGLERFARPRLASGDLAQKVLGAAAYYLARRETLLQAALREAGIRGEMAAAVKKDAHAEAERIRERQAPRRAAEKEDAAKAKRRTIAEAFPPAADVLSAEFPFPPVGKKKQLFDIRDGKVVKVRVYDEGEEEETTVMDTVALLTRRLAPLEEDAADEKWEVAWYENGRWSRVHLYADWLFDAGQRKWLIRAGVPVCSATAEEAALWFHALRCEAVLRGAQIPTTKTVSRCGWHHRSSKHIFVFGREILGLDGTEADAGERALDSETEPDPTGEVQDIIWAEDISALEKQILNSFSIGGDPERQKEFLLEMLTRYPQAAFGAGCACAAPLIALLQRASSSIKMDVSGFTVAMVPTADGRSRHQGKTCWQRIVASLFGWPEKDPRGRIRFADRTRVALGVIYAASCDLPVHVEDVHLIAQERKKDAGAEIDYMLHLTAAGAEKDRGARGGGGRRTRYFRTVAFWTAETDVTAFLPPESGSFDRVMKLPPLLPMESRENRDEAERIERETLAHYGHAGREYLRCLLRRLEEDEEGFLRELGQDYAEAVKELRREVADPSVMASADRLAKRAGLGLVGLYLLLEALGVESDATEAAVDSFFRGWEMVISNIPAENFADAAWRAVRSYVAANAERIRGLRETDRPPAPAEWAGVKTKVKRPDGREIEVIALREEEFAKAVSSPPYNLLPEHAKRALAAEGKLLVRAVKQDGREKKLHTYTVRMGDVRVPALCFPASEFLVGDSDDADVYAEDNREDEEFPF